VASAQWYGGQLVPGLETVAKRLAFDPTLAKLAVGSESGELVEAQSSGQPLTPGDWTLAVRLRHEWHDVALIPVMKISVAESGEVTYQAFEGELSARLMQ
jgi:hypothetical protein